jgi:hypothetical protein
VNRDSVCLLCGVTDPDVRVSIVAWRQPIGGKRYEAVPRCPDHAACQSRLEAQGDAWPLARTADDREEVAP